MQRALAIMVMAAAMLMPVGVAAQDDADCWTRLVMAPVETTILPEGFAFASLRVDDSWGGTIEDADDGTGNVYFGVGCRTDAELVMARTRDVTEALGLMDKVGAIIIGDESYATRSADALDLRLEWRHGDLLGYVWSSGFESEYSDVGYLPIEIGDLERIALAIDATLPD